MLMPGLAVVVAGDDHRQLCPHDPRFLIQTPLPYRRKITMLKTKKAVFLVHRFSLRGQQSAQVRSSYLFRISPSFELFIWYNTSI